MSKSSKVSFGSKISKNDPRIIAQLNTAENTRRNLYIFNNQAHSALAAKYIIDILINRGSAILYNQYLMRKKMPTYMSNLYTASIKEVEHVEQIQHDSNEPVEPHKRFVEDPEPKAIPFDNYMTDRLKIGTKKPEVLITETKSEIKRPASKRSYSRATSVNLRGQSKSSLVSSERPQGPERLSQSISISNDHPTFARGQSEIRSRNTTILTSSPMGKKKKKPEYELIPIEVKKSPRDEVIEGLRKEYFARLEDEKKRKKELEEMNKMRAANKKKIELIEKSVFKKKYTYDTNGEIIEVKNRFPPKKGSLQVHLNYSFTHDNVYVEKIDSNKPIERVVAPDWEEPKSVRGFKFQSKFKRRVPIIPPVVDPGVKKFEDLLRFYKIIGPGPFDPSQVTESMVRELERKMQLTVIDNIIPAPGVKIIENDRVKENVGFVAKYSETGFPLITKGMYERIQEKATEGHPEVSIEKPREIEKVLIEKEKNFRRLLGSIIPLHRTPRKDTSNTVSSYNDLNPLDSQDLVNNRPQDKSSSKITPDTDSKSSPKGTTNRGQSSVGTIRMGEIIQEKIVSLSPAPLRERNINNRPERTTSATPVKPVIPEHRATFMEKIYGKEELWSKRKNRKLISASKIPRIKKPDDSGNKSMFVTKGTRETDVSWISPANLTYMEEVSGIDQGYKIRDRVRVNNTNFLALLEETDTILSNA